MWDAGWEDYLEGRERMGLNTKAQPREEAGTSRKMLGISW